MTGDSEDLCESGQIPRKQHENLNYWRRGYQKGSSGVAESSLMVSGTDASTHHQVSIGPSDEDDDRRTTESGESADGQPWKKRLHRARVFFKISFLFLICLANIVSAETFCPVRHPQDEVFFFVFSLYRI